MFPLKYKNLVRVNAVETGVDAEIVASIIRVESGFDRRAVSKKGAVGLMQILPSTAEFVARREHIADYDLTVPADNIKIGTLYLRYLYDKFGDTRTVLMAYNAGEGNVSRWILNNQKCQFAETNEYVERVLNARTYYRWRV
jgi:soluble lytic murein transglycosylase